MSNGRITLEAALAEKLNRRGRREHRKSDGINFGNFVHSVQKHPLHGLTIHASRFTNQIVSAEPPEHGRHGPHNARKVIARRFSYP